MYAYVHTISVNCIASSIDPVQSWREDDSLIGRYEMLFNLLRNYPQIFSLTLDTQQGLRHRSGVC